MNYYIYISNFVQKLLFTTYIHTYIINNKLVLIESLFTTELYLKFITVITPTLSLLNIQIAQTKFNKYNIYRYIKYFKMLEHLSKWKGET